MTQLQSQTYDVQRPTGQCALTGATLEPGQPYMATLVEADEPEADTTPDKQQPTTTLKRIDISLEAWEQNQRPDNLFSYWRSTVPHPEEKKKIFVDDDILLNLFRRLEDTHEPQRVAFRFVLTLVLMRRKFLRYAGAVTRQESDSPQHYWLVIPKGGDSDHPIEVINPSLDEEQIRQVTEQLGQILEAEL